jgi:hypothetical protein
MNNTYLLIWFIISVAIAGNAAGDEIRSGAGKCLDVHAPCQGDNGCEVQVWDCNGSRQQTWFASGGGEIKSGANKCLDVHAPCQGDNGCRVQVWDCNHSPQQTWNVSGGEISSGAGKCLDVHSPCQGNNGCKVQVWGCNGSRQQRWSLTGPGPDKPDLVVMTLETTGPSAVNAENSVEIPIRVVVRNQGPASADVFKIATEYTGSRGTFVVGFTVPGQNDIWYPRTSGLLASGSDVTFSGKVTFHPSVHGVTVSLNAIADSCSGDEFMPDYCRVEESNEGNNKSTSISLSLP